MIYEKLNRIFRLQGVQPVERTSSWSQRKETEKIRETRHKAIPTIKFRSKWFEIIPKAMFLIHTRIGYTSLVLRAL